MATQLWRAQFVEEAGAGGKRGGGFRKRPRSDWMFREMNPAPLPVARQFFSEEELAMVALAAGDKSA